MTCAGGCLDWSDGRILTASARHLRSYLRQFRVLGHGHGRFLEPTIHPSKLLTNSQHSPGQESRSASTKSRVDANVYCRSIDFGD